MNFPFVKCVQAKTIIASWVVVFLLMSLTTFAQGNVKASFSAPDTICLNTPDSFKNTSLGQTTNYWNFCSAKINDTISPTTYSSFCNTSSVNIFSSSASTPPPIIYITPGTYNVCLTVDEGMPTQSSYCKPIVVRPPSTHLDFSFEQNICDSLIPHKVTFQNLSNPLDGITFHWDYGDGTSVISLPSDKTNINGYNSIGTYIVSLTNITGCPDTIIKIIPVQDYFDKSIIINHDTTICKTSQTSLNSFSGYDSYCWSPTTGLSNPNIQNPIATPNSTTTYKLTVKSIGSNLVKNGDFEQGDIGFTSDYNDSTNRPSVYSAGTYTVDTTSAIWHPFLSRCHDHTGNNGKMLIANGAPNKGTVVWQQKIDNILLNTNYIFSTWLQSLSIDNPALLRFYVNGQPISGTFSAIQDTCVWQQPLSTWNSGNNTSAIISIVDEDTIGNGNDFALDDISFYSNIVKSDTIRITVNSIEATPTIDTVICNGQAVTLSASSANTYAWNTSPYISNAALQSQTVTPTSNTQLTVARYNATGCSVTDTFNIAVANNPQLDFSFAEDICNPFAIQFKNETVGNYSYLWSFGNSSTSTNTNPSVAYSSYNTYPVTLKNTTGCADSIIKNITLGIVKDSVIVTRDTTICPGSTLALSAIPALAYCWSPSTGLSNASISNPTVTSLTQSTTYHVNAQVVGSNIIVNGDFSLGDSAINSGYKSTVFNQYEGEYHVGPNPYLWNAGMSIACTDHTTGSGNMLIVNGAPDPNKTIWLQTVNVKKNTNYAFSTWLQPVSVENPAQLMFSINGQSIGNLITAVLPLCNWQQFYTVWNSGSNTSATISIINKNLLKAGNDFALDDISFAPFEIKTDSIKITIDGTISHSPTVDTTICNGQSVMLTAVHANSYNWNTSAYITNPILQNQVVSPNSNAQFTVYRFSTIGCSVTDTFNVSVSNIKPQLDFSFAENICNPLSIQFKNETTGNYAYAWDFGNNTTSNNTNPSLVYANYGSYPIMLKNTTGCPDSITKTITLGVVTDSVIITNDTVLCPGNTLQLSSIPALAYCWSPATGLSDASIGNPSISVPTAATTYYVNANVVENNLIINGDFENGFTGFTSEYLKNTSSGHDAGVYTVSSSPRSWHPLFFPCPDHTSGTGKFMLVNGASTLDTVWSQQISIQSNTNYAFSAWAESLTSANPAQLQFTINGKKIGDVFTAASNECEWGNFYVVWNSGTAKTANISLIDLNTASGGNDFGLDDISFAKLNILRDSITVTPGSVPNVAIVNKKDTAICVGDSFQIVATGANTYQWSPAKYLSNPNIANPIAAPSQTTTYTVTGYSADKCSNTTPLNVIVNSLPTIAITKDTGVCKDSNIQLSANSPTAKTYLWQPNDSFILIKDNIIAVSPNAALRYYVRVSDNNSCANVDSVLVDVWPLPTVKTLSDTSICLLTNITLTTSSTNANSFSWLPVDGLSNSIAQSPVITALSLGTTQYIVTALSNHACTAKDTINITELPLPNLALLEPDTLSLCVGKSVQLSATATNVKGYVWIPSKGLNHDNITDPVAMPDTTTEYVVMAKGQNDCTVKDSVLIDVKQIPNFAITPLSASICKGDSVLITATGGDKYTWNPANVVKFSDSSANTVYPISNTTYQVTALDTLCGFSQPLSVNVLLNYSPTIGVYKTNDIDCILTSSTLIATGAASYIWSPTNSLSDSTSATTIASPNQTTIYKLKAISGSGCQTDTSILVNVTKGDIGNGYQVPTAFTPIESVNACFGVKEWGHVNSFRMIIYNRYGQKIFTTNNLSGCWDGRYNGIMQPAGTYVVEIDASTLCTEIHRKGTVVLIR